MSGSSPLTPEQVAHAEAEFIRMREENASLAASMRQVTAEAEHLRTQLSLRQTDHSAVISALQQQIQEMQAAHAAAAASAAMQAAAAAPSQQDHMTSTGHMTAFPSVNYAVKCNKPQVYKGTRTALAVNSFVYSMRAYIDVTKPPATDQIPLLVSYLADEALNWWINYESTHTAVERASWTFSQVLTAIDAEFRPRMAEKQAREELKTMHMNRLPFKKFLDKFTATLLTAGQVGTKEKLDWFLQALTTEFRNAVALKVQDADKLTYEEAVKAAENWELLRPGSYGKGSGSNNPSSSKDDPMDLDGLSLPKQRQQNKETKTFTNKANAKHSRLSESEKAQLRSEGKCYICKETGHMSRECPKHVRNSGNRGAGFHKH